MINSNRILEIIFVKDQKQFIQVLAKKGKSDYLLNVNKIIREKFEQDILVPNKIQSFLINYEIKKLIDKFNPYVIGVTATPKFKNDNFSKLFVILLPML